MVKADAPRSFLLGPPLDWEPCGFALDNAFGAPPRSSSAASLGPFWMPRARDCLATNPPGLLSPARTSRIGKFADSDKRRGRPSPGGQPFVWPYPFHRGCRPRNAPGSSHLFGRKSLRRVSCVTGGRRAWNIGKRRDRGATGSNATCSLTSLGCGVTCCRRPARHAISTMSCRNVFFAYMRPRRSGRFRAHAGC